MPEYFYSGFSRRPSAASVFSAVSQAASQVIYPVVKIASLNCCFTPFAAVFFSLRGT